MDRKTSPEKKKYGGNGIMVNLTLLKGGLT